MKRTSVFHVNYQFMQMEITKKKRKKNLQHFIEIFTQKQYKGCFKCI